MNPAAEAVFYDGISASPQPAAGAAAKRAGRQFNLPLAERRPPSHHPGGAGHDGRLFSAASLNADHADALVLKLLEDRGIGLFAGDHHVNLPGLAE